MLQIYQHVQDAGGPGSIGDARHLSEQWQTAEIRCGLILQQQQQQQRQWQ